MEIKLYHKYIILGVFVITFYLTYLLVKPYLITFVLATIIAVLASPLFNFIKKLTNRNKLSAVLTTLLVFVIVFIPLFFLVDTVSTQIGHTYTNIRFALSDKSLQKLCDIPDSVLCNAYTTTTGYIEKYQLSSSLQQGLREALTTISLYTYKKFASIPAFLLQTIIFVYLFYVLLVNKEYLTNKIKLLVPLNRRHHESIITRFSQTVNGVFYGQIITAIAQGLVGMLGLYIFGVPNAFILGLLMIIFAFIPLVGTAIIWLPAGMYLIISGIITSTNSITMNGILLLVYGALIVSTIDNLIKPFLIGNKAQLHPFLVMVGVFGGLALFGVMGILIGPILIGVFITLLNIYEEETHG